ncbi:hypothetical protein H5410_061727 [Solanum commersonii]|uniref:Uncharacterized protein n=1 Tax=Solanum commersonii TaxID=4109 RepID=A0A9J5W8T1_SOLCO|nr:hypothetical protein H5410_061727 [Solanum commersonii]
MSWIRMCGRRKGLNKILMSFSRGTHKGRCYGLGYQNDVRRLQSGLEGIGSSSQGETLDGVQIAAMSAQIAQLTSLLVASERRREDEK